MYTYTNFYQLQTHQAAGGKRREHRFDAQKPRQNQTERAQNFGHADEAQESTGHGNLLGHLLDRRDQLYATGKQEKPREQCLNDPECAVHVHPPTVTYVVSFQPISL